MPLPLLTTIVATIGPASDSPEMVLRLIEAGVGVFRFNFSHGDLATHAARLATVRRVSEEAGYTVACLGDLQGPKIRVGRIPAGLGEPSPAGGGMIRVFEGSKVIFKKGITEAVIREGPEGPENVLPLTYQPLVDEVEPGHAVLINDGAVRLEAVSRDAARGELLCRVIVGGPISSNKGINLPDSSLSTPAITDRDWECAAWAVQNELDFLALSFVREPADVLQLREGLAGMCRVAPGRSAPSRGAWIPIIAKIEMPQAVRSLDAIVAASDGVMVARGDLGVEMDLATVPLIQKRIVSTCRDFGKPCIVATQMLESMIESPVPTRAETTDVANAILDGADAVMLSAETAAGKFPLETVRTMARIASAAESHLAASPRIHSPPTRMSEAHRATAALASGAWQIARDLNAVAVVCWSQQGGTARYLSQNRFTIPIIACTSDAPSARQMALPNGLTPVLTRPPASGSLTEWNKLVDAFLLSRGFAKAGDTILLIAGKPLGEAKRTNTIAIHKVGEDSGFIGH
jgi:pyruvate kinase